jgi:hypothetical protein
MFCFSMATYSKLSGAYKFVMNKMLTIRLRTGTDAV